jgi:hypothetical protein
MSTGNFANWDGNVLDIGPLYPFVGYEGLMVVLLIVLWAVWHIAQLIGENRDLQDRVRLLKQPGELQKAVESERVIERM